MESALEDLCAAAAYGFADVSLASYYKIGYVQLHFLDAVMEAPRPKTLSEAQREQYDALLRQQVQPYREGAEKAFRITLEQGKTSGIENEWTARARTSLAGFEVATALPPENRPLQISAPAS